MRKLSLIIVGALFCVSMVGCASTNDVVTPQIETVEDNDVVTESAFTDVEAGAAVSDNIVEETTVAAQSEESASSLTGMWQTASMSYEQDGSMFPEYYVQFTDEAINYGHMVDGAFDMDHSDPVDSCEKTSSGYRIQATGVTGVKYTYQTAESDANVLEYYETWDESEFADTYSGGASLSRCE